MLTPNQKANIIRDARAKIYNLCYNNPSSAKSTVEYLIECELRQFAENMETGKLAPVGNVHPLHMMFPPTPMIR